MNYILLSRVALIFGLSVMLAGCVGSPVAPDASPTHPANPLAAVSPLAPFETGLLNVTNLVVPTAPPGGEPGHEHHSVQP